MPRKRIKRIAKTDGLTFDQEMNLILGPGYACDWESEEQRREAWFTHKDEILASLHPGHQPEAMLVYELGYKPSEQLAAEIKAKQRKT